MSASKTLVDYVENGKKIIKQRGFYTYQDAICFHEASKTAVFGENDVEFGLATSKLAKMVLVDIIKKETGGTVWQLDDYLLEQGKKHEYIDLFYNILLFESNYLFESFIFYMERKRRYSKRFYLPRQKVLKYVVKDLQDLEEGKYKFYGLSMSSRTGKSTICIFFLTWIALKRPNSHSAMIGHSGMLADGFYNELKNFILSEEYTFSEMYNYYHPNHVLLRDKSAENHTLTLDEPDRFATLTCRGIDGTLTGAVDISGYGNVGYLYIDDLVRDREHSLSPQRMEATWQDYLSKCVDRKLDGARELMVGTLWNVMDPLERMRKMYEGNPEYLFRRIPALNAKGESNHDYEINGFSTAYFQEIRDRLDNAEWMAKYMQQPYVREGLVFEADSLRYFNGILPEGEHRTVAVVDVAWGGGDFLSMPIGALYENGDCYIFAWVYNNGSKEETIPIVVGQIIKHGIRQVRFEGNQGGELFEQYVNEKLSEHGWKCSTESKKAPTKVSKLEKIMAYSGDIIKKFIFISPQKITKDQRDKDAQLHITRYVRDSEYQKAMDELTSFVKIGKNTHDDATDSLTQLMIMLEGEEEAEVRAIFNPFRSRR